MDIPQLPLIPIDQHHLRPRRASSKTLLGYLFGLRSTLAHTRLWRARTWGASSFLTSTPLNGSWRMYLPL